MDVCPLGDGCSLDLDLFEGGEMGCIDNNHNDNHSYTTHHTQELANSK